MVGTVVGVRVWVGVRVMVGVWVTVGVVVGVKVGSESAVELTVQPLSKVIVTPKFSGPNPRAVMADHWAAPTILVKRASNGALLTTPANGERVSQLVVLEPLP